MAAGVELRARVRGGHEDGNDFVADEVEAVGEARGDRVGVARVATDHEVVVAPGIEGAAAAVLGHADFVNLEPDGGGVGPEGKLSATVMGFKRVVWEHVGLTCSPGNQYQGSEPCRSQQHRSGCQAIASSTRSRPNQLSRGRGELPGWIRQRHPHSHHHTGHQLP